MSQVCIKGWVQGENLRLEKEGRVAPLSLETQAKTPTKVPVPPFLLLLMHFMVT